MKNPERDPTIARSNQEQDAALLEQKAAEPRRARRQEDVEGFLDGEPRMRLPKKAHTSRRWRIHEIAPDFETDARPPRGRCYWQRPGRSWVGRCARPSRHDRATVDSGEQGIHERYSIKGMEAL